MLLKEPNKENQNLKEQLGQQNVEIVKIYSILDQALGTNNNGE